MNLILASAVNAYDENIEDRKRFRKEIAKENLDKAFHLMDANNTGLIHRETIMALFFILAQDFPEVRSMTSEEAKILFG